jgi:3-oxoacyl-[acyl-carrier protein] reductase
VDLGIAGRTALVTASSKGIGKACAELLAANGANVIMCARGAEQLEAAAAEVRRVGRAGVLAVPADITRAEQVEALLARARDEFSVIDILVAIGGSPKRGGLDDITEEDLLQAFHMSVLALFRLAKALLPAMRARRWGRVVTVQSRAVREPIPELLSSVATRPGVVGMLKYLSKEVAQDGVLVNTVVPGRILTDRFRAGTAASSLGAEAYLQSKLSDIPVRRLGTPEEVASAVAFLCSERASYINGAVLQVDGGVINAI